MQYNSYYDSPLGEILITATDKELTSLRFVGQKYFDRYLEDCSENKETKIAKTVKTLLTAYFNGDNPKFDLPLKLYGTEFQKEVWEILRGIPYGHTATYGQIATKIAQKRGLRKMSTQAVGGAIAKNPILIIVPCHRVLGANGSLTGFAGGLDKKAQLLELEMQDGQKVSTRP